LDVFATIANISEEDIIDCFYNGITDPGIYRDFGRNRPKTGPSRKRRCGSGSRGAKIAL
jgi:hypothetical protein